MTVAASLAEACLGLTIAYSSLMTGYPSGPSISDWLPDAGVLGENVASAALRSFKVAGTNLLLAQPIRPVT